MGALRTSGDVSGLLHRITVVSATLDRPGVRALASARVGPCEDLYSRFGQRALEPALVRVVVINGQRLTLHPLGGGDAGNGTKSGGEV